MIILSPLIACLKKEKWPIKTWIHRPGLWIFSYIQLASFDFLGVFDWRNNPSVCSSFVPSQFLFFFLHFSCQKLLLLPLFPRQGDHVVLQCTASILKEQIKVCLSCEGFGNRLCFLETTSNAQVFKGYGCHMCSFFTSFYRLSCISECPSRSRYLLLHFGAVSVCACPAGDALQHLPGWGEEKLACTYD